MLKLVVDDIATVDQAQQALYAKGDDGKFRLQVDGIEDTSGLKSALAAERKRAADFEKAAKSIQGLGKTPDEIAAILAERAADDEKRAREKGDFDSILKQKQDEWGGKVTAAEQRAIAAEQSEKRAVVGGAVMQALAEAGVTKEGLDLLPDRLSSRVKYEIANGTRSMKIVQADGETPMAGSAKDGSATFADLVKETVQAYPSLFKRADANGSGKLPNGSAGGTGSSMGNLGGTKAERLAAIRARHPDLN